VRSNTKRLRIDFETAEAMLNHVKKGLERTYDRYDLEEEKRASFLKWETEMADVARRTGLADRLGVPSCYWLRKSAPVAANDAAELATSNRASLTIVGVQGGKRHPLLRAGFSLSSRFRFGSGSADGDASR
ncbi:MAG TPA: hypothetical protein VEB39_00630, partial [Sphingomicrobium sp.]|nr:hypothetical protein [Sphingomicrobium sp.]